MSKIIALAAAAALTLPSIALAGTPVAAIEETAPIVIEDAAGSSGGSLGSAGGGIALGVLGLAVVAFALKSDDDT